MKTSSLVLVGICGIGLVATTVMASVPQVESQDVGPVNPETQYVVSPRGVHLAAVTRKGSRRVVLVDGVPGLKFDEILTPAQPWIDSRPFIGGVLGTGSGRHATGQISVKPVTFSTDGKHFAYVVRQSQEWVLVEDGKEILRLPIPQNGGNILLQFSGDDGKHLLFASSAFQGYELWVDGQKWPGCFSTGGGGSEGTVDPLISPDGEHIAYVAQMDRDKRALIIDGKDAGYFGYNLQFTADSKHLVSLSQTPKGISLLVDGKSMFSARQILAYYLAPAGGRVAAILAHEYPDHSSGQFLLIDGKPVEATLCKQGIQKFMFSPDGKHYAAICSSSPVIFYVVNDGKKGEEYEGVGSSFTGSLNPGIAFSPDSSRLVYLTRAANKYFVVINGEESDEAFDTIPSFLFSPDGKRLAYSGYRQSPQGSASIFIDGKAERFERNANLDQFDFSPDSSRYAYLGPGSGYGGPAYVDGSALPVAGTDFAFSPDGKHIAITGYRPTDNARGLWVDGKMVYKGERSPDFLVFSADSQHVFWQVLEPDKAKAGYWNNVTYADGKPVASFDSVTAFGMVTVPTGCSKYTIHPGWQAVGAKELICLGPVGDEIKRCTVTPADTSVETLLAEAVK